MENIKRSLRVRLHGEFQPWLKFQPCFEDCVTLKVPLTPKIFVTEINFRYCPDYFGEKVFSSGFFLRMLYLFKEWKLGAFLAHGRQYRRMGLVYFVVSSQCFIHARNKHKQRERAFFFYNYRMPDSCIVFGCNNLSTK